jgi:hypothetical protein
MPCARFSRMSLKNINQHVRRYADPVVAHTHNHLLRLIVHRQADLPARFGVFGGVVEEVAERLSQAGCVCFHIYWIRRKVD